MTPSRAMDSLVLDSAEVQVWQAALDDHAAESMAWLQRVLSSDEAERAARFVFERDRLRFVAGRGILRVLLGRYLGRLPAEIVFHYGPSGKPALVAIAGQPGDLSPIHFNVAHSEGQALYAFTRAGEVGIDVETIVDMPDWEHVARTSFSPSELVKIRACEPARRRDEFFQAWTRQEALLKASGEGLGGTAPAADQTIYSLYALDAGPGFAAALAVPPGGRWTQSALINFRDRAEKTLRSLASIFA